MILAISNHFFAIFDTMRNRKYIMSFLLFAYIIVLGHAILPHGHFDDLISSDQQQNSDHEADHHHHYPFSHSVSFHLTLDKQTSYSNNSVKNYFKKSLSNFTVLLPENRIQLLNATYSKTLSSHCLFTIQLAGSAAHNLRGPPYML